jgi:hypothetical protein
MRPSIRVVNPGAFQRMLKSTSAAFVKESAMVLKMEARMLCVQYGRVTSPPDYGGEATVEGFKKRIEREVGYVFPTRDNIGKVFELIKQRDPALAKAYYHAAKSKKQSMADRIMRKAGLPQGNPTKEAHHAARTGSKGRVPSRTAPVSLLRGSEARRFTREKTNHVGLAKAGWHQAALGLGGRIRSNYVDADGRRSTPEKFPAYVRAVSRRVPGLGGATVSDSRIVIYSNVTYASDAMPEKRMRGAQREAEERIGKAMAKMAEALAAKFNSKAAA